MEDLLAIRDSYAIKECAKSPAEVMAYLTSNFLQGKHGREQGFSIKLVGTRMRK